MKVTVNRSGSESLRKAIKEIAAKQLRVGFFDTAKYADGTPVAYVAAINEFGFGPIPARPFFRPTIAAQKAAWTKTLRQGYKAVLNDRISTANMLGQLGMMAAGQVSAGIRAVMTPALSPATLKARQSRKKTDGVSTKPLVDTGIMIQSVSSQVTG